MTYNEINDDLGTAKAPFSVVAALAVHGRLPLLEQTIKRLYKTNGCVKVICSGDNAEDKKLCESLGALWVHHPNRHLGGKWNLAFKAAKQFNPDAVLFVGSSDWVSHNWFTLMQPHVETRGFAGVPGCYLADVSENIRLCHWKGYKKQRPERADETIGIGRMLSRRLLDAMQWQPFNPILNNSLDRSMKDNAKKLGFVDFMVHDDRLKALSISTNRWINKHQFEMHWSENGKLKSDRISPPHQFLSSNFPEIYEIFKPDPINEDEHSRRINTENTGATESSRVQNMPV
jgi:hypothetical protein